ncbi:efflux RND transporter permease subunit [Henriciella litoralis]|uniref:efflux RND transporter permease subunit n=1 Tax=Henriciella litoralis TaxID=568102 RepID=UPI0009FCF5A7|nr:efflux RND transporter permease subunit [Henriciella litoralis]
MANFFIDRPVFAWVIAIVIMLAGVMSLRSLPVSQYPDIAPTTISVAAVYPGASAKAVEDSVTQVIEQQMTGLDGLDYISSSSSSSGEASITLTFETGTDPDIAQVQVQNKLSLATPLLPEPVQRQGVQVNKASTGFLLITALYSPDGSYDQTDLGDYIRSNLYDTIGRVDGVGQVQLFGSQYAMRIWLDPDKLTQFDLVPGDVINAIRAQNTQVSAGSLGGSPAVKGQEINATVTLQSLLSTPEEFRNLLLRTTSQGGSVRLGDVAEVELGAELYSFSSKFNGDPASGFAVSLATGANALDTAEAVKAEVARVAKNFPEGIDYAFPVDSTPFIETSIHEVQKTLIEAVILVFLVIFVFLQSLRASFIPMVAVPVVLLGVMVVLLTLGFSINTLTMFAMVLAIGLIVDDAIVVIENVERVMEEDGLGPVEATRKSMGQITGALIGIVVVLSAVFIPMAFFPGSAGLIYRQFSVTIVSAMALSLVIALILSPALCATILKKPKHDKKPGPLEKPAVWFNNGFDSLRKTYGNLVDRILRRRWIFVGVFAVIVAITAFGFVRLPTSFLPQEDQGRVITLVQLPPGSSLERTETVLDELNAYYFDKHEDSMDGLFTLAGFSFAGRGQNNGIAFAALNDWSERTGPGDSASAIAGAATGYFSQNTDAQIFAIVPPPIQELGNASGFDLFLQDAGGVGHDALIQAQGQLLGMASQQSELVGVRPNGLADGPQFNIDIDYQKAQAFGVDASSITSLLSTAFGGTYVNDFIDRGRIKRVYVQGEADNRMQPDDLGKWYVRNRTNQMAPLEEFVTTGWTFGSPQLQRYNGFPALNIQGSPAPGVSSGVAMTRMEELVDQLQPGIDMEWTGISKQEKEAGNQATLLYILSILFVFLCLAALYESWIVPVAVLLTAPLGVAGAVLAAHLRGLDNDVFFQVALLTTVGLASKNAILIVEFARNLEKQGIETLKAVEEAVRMRLRPILMTSFAFGFGVLPLALSSGAGAAGRQAIGTAVLGGLAVSVIMGLFFAPLFYVLVRKLTGGKSLVSASAEEKAA